MEYDPEPYFRLLDLYFGRDRHVLVAHQINSFNQFIEEIIPGILLSEDHIFFEQATQDKVVRQRLHFEDAAIHPPTLENDEDLLYPLDAIHRGITYAASYSVTVTQIEEVVDLVTGQTKSRTVGGPEKNVPIARIPIMVGSKYCNLTLNPAGAGRHCRYDTGGYFIINGNEKVMVSLESMILRRPLVFTKYEQGSLTYYVQIQSRPASQLVSNIQFFTIRIKKDGQMVLTIPQFKEISIFILLRALGLEKDEDIVHAILDVEREKNMLNVLAVMMNSQNLPTGLPVTREEALRILTSNIRTTKVYSESDPDLRERQKQEHLRKILSEMILPHVTSGTGSVELDMLYKAYYIAYMIHKLLVCYLKYPGGHEEAHENEEGHGCDDRDSMVNKRIELCGVLLGNLFEQFFRKMLRECKKTFKSKNKDESRTPNIIPHIKKSLIEQGLRQALSTGNFSPSRKGVSQMLNRMNHLYALSHMRRIITPTVDAATNKMISPRHLHNTQYGSLCPLESPEGAKTGIVKNLAMLATITVNMNDQANIIEEYLRDKIVRLDQMNTEQLHQYVKVFLNGNWLGVTQNIMELYHGLREMRFRGEIERMVGLHLDYGHKEFYISTDDGRLIRPYLVVENNQLNFRPEMLEGQIKSWDEFLSRYPRVLEYLDKEEEQNMALAAFPSYVRAAYSTMRHKVPLDEQEIERINRTNRYDDHVYLRYTHCEIHPCMILGIISSNIPFPNHNQSPRGIFQYNQARQAMGLYISDYRERADISYLLYHPQVPIVASRAARYTGTHIFPSGENIIVAIMSYTGFNQEDSLIMNSSAIDKGLFRAQALKKYFETIKKNSAASQAGLFMKPDRNKVEGMRDANYEKLSEEGYVKEETYIQDGDVIIGMVNPKPISRENKRPYRDNSTIYRSIVPGAVDRVFTGVNPDGYPFVRLRVRSERIPTIGDKFSCYDEKTQILTWRGWVPFSDLTMEDRVATLEDKRLVYRQPSEIQRYEHNGYLFHISNELIDLCVTPNHRVWISRYKCPSFRRFHLREVNDVCDYETPCYHQKTVLEYDQYQDIASTENPAWFLFLGVWMASGWFEHDHICIYISNEKIRRMVVGLADSLGYETLEIGRSLRYENLELLERIRIWVRDRFTEAVWKLPMSSIRQIVQGFIMGARCLEKNVYVYLSNSCQLADDVQRLILHAGYVCDVSHVNDHYRLQIYMKHVYARMEESDLNIEEHHGHVYCCSVPSEIICVRRNGRIVFSGNSRHGQKATLGARMHRADLPFTEDGMVPDIIINPNAMPKRMTIGQLIECLLGKLCAIKGIYGDGTPFTGVDIYRINQELVEAGYEEWGNQTMYNGMTGEKLKVKIFIGPTYYQRLKQMVGDKAHARARGPMQLLTRQPPDGRARDGGLRLGEMERDALCAHGVSQFLKEKMVENSDQYTAYVCDICGLFAHRAPGKRYYICPSCKNTTRISKIVIPYAFKLFMQEIQSINILGRIRTTKLEKI
jgi:DNA-directed RNA polymerase beta subunit